MGEQYAFGFSVCFLQLSFVKPAVCSAHQNAHFSLQRKAQPDYRIPNKSQFNKMKFAVILSFDKGNIHHCRLVLQLKWKALLSCMWLLKILIYPFPGLEICRIDQLRLGVFIRFSPALTGEAPVFSPGSGDNTHHLTLCTVDQVLQNIPTKCSYYLSSTECTT